MARGIDLISWSMRNYRITFLLVGLLFILGIYGLQVMPKQEFPEFTIRQGVIVGLYPGATAEQVEEQLAKPLEEFLFTYAEIKRSKTTTTSQNGVCYAMVELDDRIHNKDEVWSKIKHGLSNLKMQLPSGVVALVANDDFGDTSALLIAVESDRRSYRELQEYLEGLSDRLRRIESVSNLRTYGLQREQIGIYVDHDRLAAYGIGDKVLAAQLTAEGMNLPAGSIENDLCDIPLHVAVSLSSEEEVAERIVFSDAEGRTVRVGDIARVVREYPDPDSYITFDGHRCVILSLEMRKGHNIVQYGRDVDRAIRQYADRELPDDVAIHRIADQPEVVRKSVSSFLRDLILSMLIIVVVMMLLFPFRSALVASITVPLSTFISVGIMYVVGIPLNTVTLAALIVVLGMIVDNSIVVIDGYLEYLDRGYSRWHAAQSSARQYAMPMLLATASICAIFYPILFTMTGMEGDFIRFFPWTITINLCISLLLAVTVIPLLNFLLIRRRNDRTEKLSLTDRIQKVYLHVLEWTFRHGRLTIALGGLSVVAACLLFLRINFRMMPIAERDQFAVEIYLPEGTPVTRTGTVADSLRTILSSDSGVVSVTSFIGCSSPRFQAAYAPQMGGRNYAQFIVNTRSEKITEELLDRYADSCAHIFPDAFVKFKQLDYQNYETLEYRFYGDDIAALKATAEKLTDRIRPIDALLRVRTDYERPRPLLEAELDPVTSAQIGISRSTAAAALALATDGITAGTVWEGDYGMPVVVREEHPDGKPDLQRAGDIYLPTPAGSLSVPLRQVADLKLRWSESRIIRRDGVRTVSVLADMRRDAQPLPLNRRIKRIIAEEILPEMPSGVRYEIGGEEEHSGELLPPIIQGLVISLVLVFFIILFSFGKFGISIVSLLSSALCLFGAAVGVWLSGVTIGITAIFGFISLLGMIMRNVILMYQHAEDQRRFFHAGVREAAFDAGRRRMVPIFLTTATSAVGVVPMIMGGSSFWMPVGIIIFAGGIGSLVAVVTVLPVLYWKLYK